MFSKIKKSLFAAILVGIIALTPVILSTPGCTPEQADVLTEIIVQALASWNLEDEQLDSIPQDVDIHDTTEITLTKIDLTPKFPPIGDQGSYGTCVAWAVGYNLKTALNAIDNQWTASQLSSTTNITSPKDLFWSIPKDLKGEDCNGTQFESAMDALISRGGASLATAPYVEMGDCSQSPPGSWATDAADNKLVNYRKIADQSNPASMTVANFKAYLAEGRPVAIGARLGDRFMKWNSDAVIDNDTYLNPGMQHAYHAMVLAGFDDSKSAFKVINSWGTGWGNYGYIWVDYDFFVSNFCFAGFVAQNTNNTNVSGGEVNSGDLSDGLDVMAWNLVEEDNPESDQILDRQITYNVFNSGTETVYSSSDWSILYMYYNAYDANDYGILIHDYYTDDFSTIPGENGYYENGYGIAGSWWNYINVPSGKSVAAALYNQDDADFKFTFTMPSTLNGQYYLVLIADGFENLKEVNEDNNYIFWAKSDGKPFEFVNGVIQNGKSAKSAIARNIPARFANHDKQSLVKGNNLNTYSPQEIMKLIKHRKATGDLQKKVNEYHQLKNSAIQSKQKSMVKY